MPNNDPNDPFFESCVFQEMDARWKVLRVLRGGTRDLKKNAAEFIPQEPAEKDDKYGTRLKRTHLYGGLDDTIEKVVAKPFQEMVTLENAEGLHPSLQALEKNADGEGRGLTQFASALFEDGCEHGLMHAKCDARQNPERRGGGSGAPYFSIISPKHTIGWRDVRDPEGDRILTQLRYRDDGLAAEGPFGEKKVERVRVWYPDRVETWVRDTDRNPVKLDPVTHTFGGIPVATAYLNRTGFMQARSPFEELADQNWKHVQLDSMLTNALNFASYGIVFGSGFKPGEHKQLALGPITFITNKDPASSMSAVDFSAAALAELAAEVIRTQDRMETLGHQPFVQQVAQTATGVRTDEAKSQAAIHKWVRDLENLLLELFRMAAKWLDVTLPKAFRVKVFSDFSIARNTAEDMQELREDFKNGAIDHRTYLMERLRRGLYSESMNVEEVIRLAQLERARMSGFDAVEDGADEDDTAGGEDEGRDTDVPDGGGEGAGSEAA